MTLKAQKFTEELALVSKVQGEGGSRPPQRQKTAPKPAQET